MSMSIVRCPMQRSDRHFIWDVDSKMRHGVIHERNNDMQVSVACSKMQCSVFVRVLYECVRIDTTTAIKKTCTCRCANERFIPHSFHKSSHHDRSANSRILDALLRMQDANPCSQPVLAHRISDTMTLVLVSRVSRINVDDMWMTCG
jgi:hypothetical protein